MDTHQQKEFTKASHASSVWIAFAVIFLVAIFFASNTFSRSAKEVNTGNITLVVDYGTSKQKWSGQFGEKMRVWDLLQQATAISNIALAATNNFVPHRIDGHQNNAEWGWHYYLNGTLETTTPFDTFVSGGDEVVFKWEKY